MVSHLAYKKYLSGQLGNYSRRIEMWMVKMTKFFLTAWVVHVRGTYLSLTDRRQKK